MSRTPILNLRVDEETKARWQREADEAGLSLSEYVRGAVSERRNIGGAQKAVARAIKLGVIERPTACEECGATDRKIQAAHRDYAFPLDVRWLCPSCHRSWDATDPKQRTASNGLYLLEAPDDDLAAWKAAAKRAGVSFAEWLRLAARRLADPNAPLVVQPTQLHGRVVSADAVDRSVAGRTLDLAGPAKPDPRPNSKR